MHKLQDDFIDDFDSLMNWIHDVKMNTIFDIKPVSITDSKEWIYETDVIHHKTNSFFKVVACREKYNPVNEQPLLEQREIGLLGNIVCDYRGKRWILLQLKSEPGMVNQMQLTCSVQATRSNMKQKHGGSKPLYSEFFNSSRSLVISHSHETEQGSRFLGKWNACWTVKIHDPKLTGQLGSIFRWVDIGLIARTIDTDFLFTTDFRSVFICSSWTVMFNIDNELVSKNKSFVRSLKEPKLSDSEIKNIIQILNKKSTVEKIPFKSLHDWTLETNGLVYKNRDSGFNIEHFESYISGREVEKWDQPLICSKGEGKIILFVRINEGILEFALVPRDEIGYLRRLQLSTPYLVEPGQDILSPELDKAVNSSELLYSCTQSEEGGRFYKEVNRYEIRMLEQPINFVENIYWLRLSDIQKMKGILNSETRSALSLLSKLFCF